MTMVWSEWGKCTKRQRYKARLDSENHSHWQHGCEDGCSMYVNHNLIIFYLDTNRGIYSWNAEGFATVSLHSSWIRLCKSMLLTFLGGWRTTSTHAFKLKSLTTLLCKTISVIVIDYILKRSFFIRQESIGMQRRPTTGYDNRDCFSGI